MIRIENKEVFSTEGRTVHRIGSDTYFKRGTVLDNDAEADFEEVDEIPPFTKEEYDAKVAELVRRRYSASEEFAIQRKAVNLMLNPQTIDADSEVALPILDDFNEYNAYVEECKVRARDAEIYTIRE